MILVLGGTKEAHELCDYLIAEEIEFYLSVATDYAIDIFKAYDKYMIVGKLDKNGIINFCEKNSVDLINLTGSKFSLLPREWIARLTGFAVTALIFPDFLIRKYMHRKYKHLFHT